MLDGHLCPLIRHSHNMGTIKPGIAQWRMTQGGKAMSVEIKQRFEWLQSLDEGLQLARETGKNILFDFFNPG